MASLPLRFSDGNLVRNKKELKEAFNKYASDIIKCISDGRLAEFLDGKEETWKMLVEEGLNTGRRELEIYKQLAEKMGVTVDINNVSDRSIVKHEGSLKDVFQSEDSIVEFPSGNWEEVNTVKISCSKEISGMGDDTALKIENIVIDMPKETKLTMKNLFLRSCGEDSLIIVKNGQVYFHAVHFERVRIEALGDSYVKVEDCKFELLNQPALTENDDSRIDCGEGIKYDKCSKPHLFLVIDASREISDENIESYLQAAERENALAQYKLGEYYFNIKNYKQAVEWFRKAAEQGNVEAQYKLGDYYFDEEDYKEAVQWYLKAAEQGHMVAQCKLGECYLNGRGVSINADEAVKWLRKSTEQGYAQAQYKLARIYSNSYYGFYNRFEAAVLYLKSAEQGYVEAQYKIGECYFNGDGVDQDKSQGEKWYKEFLKGAEELPRETFKYLVRRGHYDMYDIWITNKSKDNWKADIIIEVKIGKNDYYKIKKVPRNLAFGQEGCVEGFPLTDIISNFSDFSVKLYRWKSDEKILDIL